MNKKHFLLLTLLFSLVPLIAMSGFSRPDFQTTDTSSYQLTSYYDLRNRESFIQVTNVSSAPITIHVQIFQNDVVGCPELNFFDTLTANDTHVYNMRNLEGNGIPVNVSLNDNSNGFVVITEVSGVGLQSVVTSNLIGNFRIVDSSGYEYRTNSSGIAQQVGVLGNQIGRLTFNFNEIGGSNQSDIVAIALDNIGGSESRVDNDSISFSANIFNNSEVATSCDIVNFACGNESSDTLNLGINDVFPNTNGDNLICSGSTVPSGFVELIPITTLDSRDNSLIGFVGLNNGNGRGSMDSMWSQNLVEEIITEELVEICDDGIDNDGINGTDCADIGCDGSIVDTGGGSFECEPDGEAMCSDGFDNDRNGLTDCADMGCDGTTIDTVGGSFICETNGETICDDGFDNDQNGFIDCADFGCDGTTIDTGGGSFECEPGGETICDDGFDNDGDGLIDTQDTVDCPQMLFIDQSSFMVCSEADNITLNLSFTATAADRCNLLGGVFQNDFGQGTTFVGGQFTNTSGDNWFRQLMLGPVSANSITMISVTYECFDVDDNSTNGSFNPINASISPCI